MRKDNQHSILILHNIRSSQNVGSLFRTAECAGIEKIILSGYTPAPIDKFGRKVGEIAKTALGSEEIMKWESHKFFSRIVQKLKEEGFKIIAIEQDKRSIDYKKVKLPKRVAFVLGNEPKGLSKKELDLCDTTAEIPMKGKKESLNVSVAGGIAIFRILNI